MFYKGIKVSYQTKGIDWNYLDNQPKRIPSTLLAASQNEDDQFQINTTHNHCPGDDKDVG